MKKIIKLLCLTLMVVFCAVMSVACTSDSASTKEDVKPEVSIFNTETAEYLLSSDYSMGEKDVKATGGEGRTVALNNLTSFDLGGKTLDLNGYTLQVQNQAENFAVKFKNGNIKNGSIVVDVPNGDIDFDGVNIAESVTTDLTAAPSTVRFTGVVSMGAVVLNGSSRMFVVGCSFNVFNVTGSSTIDIDSTSSIESVNAGENTEGASIKVAEGAQVENISASAPITLDVLGDIGNIVIEDIAGESTISVVVIIYQTATVKSLQLNDSAEVEISGKVESVNVAEGIEETPSITVNENAVVESVAINSNSNVEIAGTVKAVEMGENAEGSEFNVQEDARVLDLVIGCAISANISGTVSSVAVQEGIDQTQVVLVIIIASTADVSKLEVCAVANVQISGTVGTLEVGESAGDDENMPSIIINGTAQVERLLVSAPSEMHVKGSVNNILLDENAGGSALSLERGTNVQQIVTNANDVVVSKSPLSVVVSVVIVNEDSNFNTSEFSSGTNVQLKPDESMDTYFEHVHTYVIKDFTPSTCQENGLIEYVCSCGETYTEETALSDHLLVAGTDLVMPTFEQNGSITLHCAHCEHTEQITIPEFSAENYEIVGNVIPSCEQGGYVTGMYYYKNVCIVVYLEIEAHGHNYVENRVDATCCESGHTSLKCTYCGDEKDFATLEPLGHNPVNNVCSRCGVKISTEFKGYVYSANSSSLLSNVSLKITGVSEKGESIERTVVSSSGQYSFSKLPYGDYQLVASYDGYIDNVQVVKVNMNNQVNDALYLVSNVANPVLGSISGQVVDASTGLFVTGLKVALISGTNNKEGEAVATTTTASNGSYSFSGVAIGNYTVKVYDDRTSIINDDYRYGTNTVNVAVYSGANKSNQNVTVSNNASLDLNSMRIVLTWGSSPSDLDSYLRFGSNTVYYSSKNLAGASLDVDDTNSYGPETITISKISQGTTYTYYVHDYTNKGSSSSRALANSGATVKVYYGDSASPIYTFYVPSGSGYYWTVFSFNTNTGFREINRVGTSVAS